MNNMMISGEGLGILIACKPIPIHHWMAFASWYSIKKSLPDAHVLMICDLQPVTRDLFNWTHRCKVRLIRQKLDIDLEKFAEEKMKGLEKKVIISPYVMAIREYNEDSFGPVPARSEQFTTLVDCEDGCGKFVASKWIDRLSPPFLHVKSLRSDDLTVNETKVFKVWESCNWLYTATSTR